MQKYINQAKYNRRFHNNVHENFCDDYFDWKITALFYTALHYIKAYIKSRGLDPGSTHQEIDNQINPKKPNSPLKISVTCWDNYRNLYQYSRTARYEGFMDLDVFKSDRKADHIYSETHLMDIMKYVNSHGVTVDEVSDKKVAS